MNRLRFGLRVFSFGAFPRKSFMMFRIIFAIFCTACLMAGAQDQSIVEPKSLPAPDDAVAAVTPVAEKLDGNRYRIGKVEFDQKTREIRFPAKVNMTEGLLEFLVVHENGKVHESLLTTAISATHLNVVFTLLRYPASAELYALVAPSGGLSNEFPKVPEDIKAGARVRIEFEWKEDGKTRRQSASEWIRNAHTNKTMPSGPWVYGGSEVFDGKFVPESTGDLIAIFIARSAMINFPGDDNSDDEVWLPYPKRVPAEGTEVTVILSPYQSNKSPKSPKSPKS